MADIDLGQLVSFRVGNEMFATSISRVQEIIRMPAVVKVPKSPDFVKGVINLRGRVIPVVDLKTKFEIEGQIKKDESRIIITEINNVMIGLIVDAVSEVIQVSKSSFSDTPEIVSGAKKKFVKGVVQEKDEMIMVLNVDNILSDDESNILKSVK